VSKTEWDAMSAREKDALVAEQIMGWTRIEVDDEQPDQVPYLQGPDEGVYYPKVVAEFPRLRHAGGAMPCYSSSHFAVIAVENEIEQRGLRHAYMGCLWRMLCQDVKETPVDMGWAFRRVSPDLCCYCAVKACEEAEADS